MTSRPNSESKLISALINTGDATAAGVYGVHTEMFSTHAAEYRWLVEYPSTYECQPTPDALSTRYPDFPFSPSANEVGFLSDDVKDRYISKRMKVAAHGIMESLRNGDNEEAFQYFASIQHSGREAHYTLRNVLHDEAFLDHFDDPVDRIEMPWKTVQRCTGGPGDGDFWVIAGRQGHGKSWMIMDIIASALMTGENCLLFSLEMGEAQMRARIHAMLARQLGFDATHQELHKRTIDKSRYRKLLGEIREHVPGELMIYDMSRGPVSTAHVAAMSKGFDMASVDHLGLLHTPTGKRAIDDWREMATISNICKEIAQVNTVPLVCAAQINREGDSRKGWKPPRISQLAQSDAIGQDADVVITMRQRSKSVLSCSIEKNRHGEGSYFHTTFQPNVGNLSEITKTRADSIVDAEIARYEED